MLGIISVPENIITTRKFQFVVTTADPIDLQISDIVFKTVRGDDLGSSRDEIIGNDTLHIVSLYIDKNTSGTSEICIEKIDCPDMIVEYDTVEEIEITWGEHEEKGTQIHVPFKLSEPVSNLKKRVVQVLPSQKFYLYGSDDDFRIVIPKPKGSFVVSAGGVVPKKNGLKCDLIKTQKIIDIEKTESEDGNSKDNT